MIIQIHTFLLKSALLLMKLLILENGELIRLRRCRLGSGSDRVKERMLISRERLIQMILIKELQGIAGSWDLQQLWLRRALESKRCLKITQKRSEDFTGFIYIFQENESGLLLMIIYLSMTGVHLLCVIQRQKKLGQRWQKKLLQNYISGMTALMEGNNKQVFEL